MDVYLQTGHQSQCCRLARFHAAKEPAVFPAQGFGTEVSHLLSTARLAVYETLLFFLLHSWNSGRHTVLHKTNKLSHQVNFVSPDTVT